MVNGISAVIKEILEIPYPLFHVSIQRSEIPKMVLT